MTTEVRKNNDAMNKLNKMFRDCGFPNVRLVITNSVDKEGHNVEERNLIVNGYIFRSYELFQIAIKYYVKKCVIEYKNLSNFKINMELLNSIDNYYRLKETAESEWQRIRWKQIFVLVRCLVKSLRFSNDIDKDLNEIFDSKDCSILDLILAEEISHDLIKVLHKEWIQEYDTPYKD